MTLPIQSKDKRPVRDAGMLQHCRPTPNTPHAHTRRAEEGGAFPLQTHTLEQISLGMEAGCESMSLHVCSVEEASPRRYVRNQGRPEDPTRSRRPRRSTWQQSDETHLRDEFSTMAASLLNTGGGGADEANSGRLPQRAEKIPQIKKKKKNIKSNTVGSARLGVRGELGNKWRSRSV